MPPDVAPPPVGPALATTPAPCPRPPAPADRAEAVVRRILQADDVPAFSRVMQELMTSLGSDSSSAPQLASLVLRDYAITARVIRTANSAHYNRSGRPVQSATHAIMLLGARTVRELASGVLLFEQYGRRSPGLKELMLLSLLTASHARAAAEAVGGADPETAHLCGMFRNLGEVLVAAHLSDEYAAVLRRLARGPAGTRGPEAARAAAAVVELGCTFEDVGAAVARHWGMPDAVRQAMFAAGAAGEARVDALAAFGHALTGAVYRGDPGRSAAGTAALLDGQGARLGISRALCKRVADRAVADTRELFAAAGLRLDDLRLTRQVTEALAEPGAAPGAGGRAPAGDLAGMPPAGAPALAPPLDGAPAARSLADVRAHLAPELAAAVDDVEGYDLGRVLLLALEAALRGGPCDRACFHAADHTAAAFRPRTALGDCTDTLLSAPGLGFSAADGPSGPALLRGEEVLLGPGTRLSLGEQQLLRRWDAVTVILLPVAVDGVVIGALHADRRTRFAAPDAAAMSYLREVAHALGRAMALRRGGRTTPAAAACAQAPVDPPATPPAVTAAQLAAAQPKVDAVLCLLRGEAPEAVAAAAGVDVATLEAWRAEFLAGAAARLAR